MKSKAKQNRSLLLFSLPAMLVYLIFKLLPASFGIFYSVTDWNGLNKNFNIIGLDNFKEILSDVYFWNSIIFTLKYVVVMVIVANILALLLAVLIESLHKAKGFFRTIFYMPNMISMIIGGYMWMFIFTKVLYYFADNYGMKFLDHSWIGNPKWSFIAIVIVSSWAMVGYLMIIYIAALQGIPSQIKESAYLDGAGTWTCFFKIILPMIRHALTICVFWTLNAGFQVFDVIFSLTGGGPGRATQSVSMNIYEEAFKNNIRFGYATAKSTTLFIIVLVITLIQIKFMKKRELEL
ncbi:MAG: sugar ABC transporter permease [Sphaerochaetaceae bacterium]|nr:sugar ABC transporter permease [Sphaerochaetaceae bacterium]